MTIAKILSGRSPEVFHLGPNASLQEAVRMLGEKRIGCLPVVDGGAVVGIISERDVVRKAGKSGAAVLLEPVASVMTSPALTIGPELDVMDALGLMTDRRVRHLPVIEENVMIGFVSIGDLVKYRIDRIEEEATAMRAYIQSA